MFIRMKNVYDMSEKIIKLLDGLNNVMFYFTGPRKLSGMDLIQKVPKWTINHVKVGVAIQDMHLDLQAH